MSTTDDARPVWLLLLPCAPSDVSIGTLKAAYGPALSELLRQASKVSSGTLDVVLDVAVACEPQSGFSYLSLQRLFGLMYRLICVICTQQRIDLQYSNDVDARLILFRRMSDDGGHQNEGEIDGQAVGTVIIDLQMLARANRAWQRIYSLEGEIAEKSLQKFLKSRYNFSSEAVPKAHVERLPGGLVIQHQPPLGLPLQNITFHHHDSVAVGGTFDHLHAGHKLLLTMAAFVLNLQTSERIHLTIGITGDELLKKKQYREELEDFPQRQSTVQKFLLGILELISPNFVLENTQTIESSGPFGRQVLDTLRSGLIISYVEIFDPCGPTITDEAISALVLSAETRSGGHVVNDKRREKGWAPLSVFEVEVLDAGEDETSQADNEFQNKISSTDIRRRVHQKSTQH